MTSISSFVESASLSISWLAHELKAGNPFVIVNTALVVTFTSWSFIMYLGDSRVWDKDGKLIPGPKNNFVSPNVFTTMLKARDEKQAGRVIHEVLLRQLGDGNIVAGNIFGRKMIFINHPDMIKNVLSAPHYKFPKADRYNRLRFFLGDGLITSSGDVWKEHRGFINPAFHADALKSFVEIFNYNMHRLFDLWDQQLLADGKDGHRAHTSRFDFNKDLTSVSLWIISQSAFGFDYFKKADNDIDINHHVQVVTNELSLRFVDPTEWWRYLFPERRRLIQSSTPVVFGLVDQIVQDRIKERETSNGKIVEDRPRDLLDILMSGDGKFTARQLRDHSLTFLGAGHETTSSTLLWVFYLLSQHPVELQRCLNEVDAVMPKGIKSHENASADRWGYIQADDINKFVYLQQVIKEALRLYPTVPLLARNNVDEVKLGDYTIPPGCVIATCIYSAHRHPDFWDNPDKFDPDRFSPENHKSTMKSSFQFLPFSAGPRNCLGQRFAIMEATTILALILRNFTFHIKPEDYSRIALEETITFQPKNVFVMLEPR